MMRATLFLLLWFAAGVGPAAAQDSIDPTTCPTTADDPSAIAVSHAGRTYHVVNEACRAAFVAEPERYSQLFDALAELETEGRTPPARRDTSSLVPS